MGSRTRRRATNRGTCAVFEKGPLTRRDSPRRLCATHSRGSEPWSLAINVVRSVTLEGLRMSALTPLL